MHLESKCQWDNLWDSQPLGLPTFGICLQAPPCLSSWLLTWRGSRMATWTSGLALPFCPFLQSLYSISSNMWFKMQLTWRCIYQVRLKVREHVFGSLYGSLPGMVDLLLCPLLLPLRAPGLSGCVDADSLPLIHTGGVSRSNPTENTLCHHKSPKGFPSAISKFDCSHQFGHWRKEMCVSYTGGINAPLTFILLEEMCIFRGKTVIHSRHASETNPILFTSLKRSELCNWMPQPLYS